jgi:hypothetical protein
MNARILNTLGLALFLVAGCTTTENRKVKIAPSPVPRVTEDQRLPLAVALVLDDAFTTHALRHELQGFWWQSVSAAYGIGPYLERYANDVTRSAFQQVSVFASPAAATGQADVLLVPKVARSTLVLPHPIDVGLVVEWMALDRTGEQVLWLTTLESSARSKKAGGRGVNAASQQCFDQLTRMTLEAFTDSAELRRISATRP